MLSGIKQKVIVGKDGKVELSVTEILEGTVVEVFVLFDSSIQQENETASLLISEANKKCLLEAIENVKEGDLIYVDLDEYFKSYS